MHSAGTKSARGITIQVTDETGKPVDGAAVSFRMPEEGPGATFARGMRTDIAITTPDGRAGVHELQAGSLPGPFQVRITAVKGQVRAGTIVGQYISDAPVKAEANASNRRRWLTISTIVAGGAAAGLVLGISRGGSKPSATATAPTAPPHIGSPTISIGTP